MTKRALVILVVVLIAAIGARLIIASRSRAAAARDVSAPGPPTVAQTLTSNRGGRPLYVSAEGRPDADGSIEHPVDLATALSAMGPTNPGDTVWIRGGTYRGNFVSALRGAEAAPILVSSYPGERATISAESATKPALTVNGAWTWYSGFEIMNEKPERATAEVQNVAIRRGVGVDVEGIHLKFIDLVVHDLEGGFDIFAEAEDVELYGNLIYYNGWQRADGVGEGHGITTPSQAQHRFIRDNIIFDQFSHGIQSFGGRVDNLYIEGNVLFNNGGIARYLDRHVMVGGGSKNLVLERNATYYTAGPAATGEGVGFGGECTNARIVDNYLTGSNPLNLSDCRPAAMTGNTLYGRFDGAYAGRYPENMWVIPKNTADPAMSGLKVLVRPNQYDPARTNLIVFNWDRLPTVQLDAAQAGLKPSDSFEIRNAQDYFAPPVLGGTYSGGPLTIPTRGLSMAHPIGMVTRQPSTTLPEFGVFILIKGSGGAKPVSTTVAK